MAHKRTKSEGKVHAVLRFDEYGNAHWVPEGPMEDFGIDPDSRSPLSRFGMRRGDPMTPKGVNMADEHFSIRRALELSNKAKGNSQVGPALAFLLGLLALAGMINAAQAMTTTTQPSSTTDPLTTLSLALNASLSVQPVTDSPTLQPDAGHSNSTLMKKATLIKTGPRPCLNSTGLCVPPSQVTHCYSLTNTTDLSTPRGVSKPGSNLTPVVQVVDRVIQASPITVRYTYRLDFDLGLSERAADAAGDGSLYLQSASSCLNTVKEKGTFCGDNNLYGPVINSYTGLFLERLSGGGVQDTMTYSLDTTPRYVSCSDVFHEPWWSHGHLYDRCCETAGEGMCHQAANAIGSLYYLNNGSVPASKAFAGGPETVWEAASCLASLAIGEHCTSPTGLIPDTYYNGRTFHVGPSPQVSYPMYGECHLHPKDRRAFILNTTASVSYADSCFGPEVSLLDTSFSLGVDIIGKGIPSPDIYRIHDRIVSSSIGKNSSYALRARNGQRGAHFGNATATPVSRPLTLVHDSIPVAISQSLASALGVMDGVYSLSIDKDGTAYLYIDIEQQAVPAPCSKRLLVNLADTIVLANGQKIPAGPANLTVSQLSNIADGSFLRCAQADSPYCPGELPYHAPTPFYSDITNQLQLEGQIVAPMSNSYASCNATYTLCAYISGAAFCQVISVGNRLLPRSVEDLIKVNAVSEALETFMSISGSSVMSQVDLSLKISGAMSRTSAAYRQWDNQRTIEEAQRISQWTQPTWDTRMDSLMATAQRLMQSSKDHRTIEYLVMQAGTGVLTRAGTPTLGSFGQEYSLVLHRCTPVHDGRRYLCNNEVIVYYDLVGTCFSMSCQDSSNCPSVYKHELGAREFADGEEMRSHKAAAVVFGKWDMPTSLYSTAVKDCSDVVAEGYVQLKASQLATDEAIDGLTAFIHRQDVYAHGYRGAETGSSSRSFGEQFLNYLKTGMADVWKGIKDGYESVAGILGKFTPFGSAFWNLILIIVTVVLIGWVISALVGLWLKRRRQRKAKKAAKPRVGFQEDTVETIENPLFRPRAATAMPVRMVVHEDDTETEQTTAPIHQGTFSRLVSRISSHIRTSAVPQVPQDSPYDFVQGSEPVYELAQRASNLPNENRLGRSGYSVIPSEVASGNCLRVKYNGTLISGGGFSAPGGFTANLLPGEYDPAVFQAHDGATLSSLTKVPSQSTAPTGSTFNLSRYSSDLTVSGLSAASGKAYLCTMPSMVAAIGSGWYSAFDMSPRTVSSIVSNANRIPASFISGWELMPREQLACMSLVRYLMTHGNAQLVGSSVTSLGAAFNLSINGAPYFTHPLLCTSLPVILAAEDANSTGGTGVGVIPVSLLKQTLDGTPAGALESTLVRQPAEVKVGSPSQAPYVEPESLYPPESDPTHW